MQDPTSTSIQGVKLVQYPEHQYPEHEQLKCPRCYSTNTKFCYYNNYNLSQPRHFCKSCRRYWTKGGSLRNVPVGGGSHKSSYKRSNKRGNPYPTRQLQDNQTPSPVLTTGSFTATTSTDMNMGHGSGQDLTRKRDSEGLSFSPMLTRGQFVGGVNSGSVSGSGRDPTPRNGEEVNNCETGGGGGQEGGYLEGEVWGNSNGWPDLAIFAPFWFPLEGRKR